jgi:hypothetical protein
MVAYYTTFGEMQSRVASLSKMFTEKKTELIGHLINEVYLSEIIPSLFGTHPPFWLIRESPVKRSKAPTALYSISQAEVGVFATGYSGATGIVGAHNYEVEDLVAIWGVEGMTEVNGIVGRVATVPNSYSFTLTEGEGAQMSTYVDTSGFTAYSSGGYVYHHGVTAYYSAWTDIILNMTFQGGKPMQPMTPDEWAKKVSRQDSPQTANYPTHYRFKKSYDHDGGVSNHILFYPYPDTADLLIKYNYVEMPWRLEADSDVPLLPPQFHNVIVSGAVSKALKSDDPERMLWSQLYSAQLTALHAYNNKYWDEIALRTPVHHYMS